MRSALLLIALAACGGAVPEEAALAPALDGCAVHERPSFVLGVMEGGDFRAVDDGASLEMVPGIQGGCHLELAFETDGFAERRLEIAYALAGDEGPTDSRSRNRVRLSPLGDGRCAHAGYVAYLVDASSLRDRRLRLTVTVTDDGGASATVTREVTLRWPEGAAPSVCG